MADDFSTGEQMASSPCVVWLTGLSGAGKSTISDALILKLKEAGIAVEHLDGDVVREFFPQIGFSKAERENNVRCVGFAASLLEKNGICVVVSMISPYQESRDHVRSHCRNFLEVYISTPLAVCEQRDVKGLYAKARAGKISNMTGVSDPYEPPQSPELAIDTSQMTVEQSVALILKKMMKFQRAAA